MAIMQTVIPFSPLTRFLFPVILTLSFIACQKGPDPVPPTPPRDTTNPVIPRYDSTWVLIKTNSSNFGVNLYMYDNQNRLSKTTSIYSIRQKRSIVFNYLPSGSLSHVLFTSDGTLDAFDGQKKSALFRYNANGKVTLAYYKADLNNFSPDTDAYFATFPDPNSNYGLDSVVYTPNGFVSEVFSWNNRRQTVPTEYVKFFYTSPTDSIPFKIEKYNGYGTGNLSVAIRLTFTTNQYDNPLYKYVPLSPFLYNLSAGSYGYSMAFLFEQPGFGNTYKYLAFVPKCVASWVMEDFSGNGQPFRFSNSYGYTFSADSSYFTGNGGIFFGDYTFKKVRK